MDLQQPEDAPMMQSATEATSEESEQRSSLQVQSDSAATANSDTAAATQSNASPGVGCVVGAGASTGSSRAVHPPPVEEDAMNVIDAEVQVSEVFPLGESDFQMSQLGHLSHLPQEGEQASDFHMPSFLHRLDPMSTVHSATSSSTDAILFDASAPLASLSSVQSSVVNSSCANAMPTTVTSTHNSTSRSSGVSGTAVSTIAVGVPAPPVHYSRKEDKIRQLRQHPAILSVSPDGREVLCKCRRRVRLNPPWYIIKFEQHMASRNCSLLNAHKTRSRANSKRSANNASSRQSMPSPVIPTTQVDESSAGSSPRSTSRGTAALSLTETTQSLCAIDDVVRYLSGQRDSETKQKQMAFCHEISKFPLFSRLTLNGKFVECKCSAIIVLGGAWKMEKYSEHVAKQLCKKPYKKRVRKGQQRAQDRCALMATQQPTTLVGTTSSTLSSTMTVDSFDLPQGVPLASIHQNDLLMALPPPTQPQHRLKPSSRKRPLVLRWNAVDFKNVPPCPGLRDPRFSAYAQRALQLTGGNRPRHVIAKELFPSLVSSDGKAHGKITQRLSRAQRDFLHDVTQQEALWFVDKDALCVRSLECKGMVDTAAGRGSHHPEVSSPSAEACSSCEELRFNNSLRNSMTTVLKKPLQLCRAGGAAMTSGIVSSNHITFLFEKGELCAMDSKSAKLMRTLLRMNIDEDSVLNLWLDFAEMGMDGAFDSHPAFLGLVDSMTRLRDKAQRGVGLQNMAYNNALDTFMSAMGDISMASAELFQQHLCGRITSKSQSNRKRKREEPNVHLAVSQAPSHGRDQPQVQASMGVETVPIASMDDPVDSAAADSNEALPLALSMPNEEAGTEANDTNQMLLYESSAAQTERLVAMLEASADAQQAAHAMMPTLDIHDMDLSSFSTTPAAGVEQPIYSSPNANATSNSSRRILSTSTLEEETANVTTEEDKGSVSRGESDDVEVDEPEEEEEDEQEAEEEEENENENEEDEEDGEHDGCSGSAIGMAIDNDATLALAVLENGKQLSEDEKAQVSRELVIAQISRDRPLQSLPCTGLRDDKVTAYVAVAAQVIGGSRPRYVIAKELFPEVFPDNVKRVKIVDKLSDAQRLLLQDAVYRECLWRVDKVGKCVRSLHCERVVDRNRSICSACRQLRSHGNFRSVLSRAKRAPPRNIENLKFVPSVYSDGDPFLRKISKNASFRCLYLTVKRQLAPETAKESQLGMPFWLKVAVMGLRGEFHTSSVFEGLVQSMMELKDKERRGVGKQNMQYSKALDDFMNALAGISMEAFELFAAQFCGRTVRSQKVKHRREKDQPVMGVRTLSADAPAEQVRTRPQQLEETATAVTESAPTSLTEDFFAVDHRRLSSSEMEESQRLMDHMLNEVRLNLGA